MKFKFKIYKDIAGLYTIAIETKKYIYKYCYEEKTGYYFSADNKNTVYWENIKKVEKEFIDIIKNEEINIFLLG